MQRLSYSEIQYLLEQNKVDIERMPKLNISVLRNITVEPVKPFLQYEAYRIGFDAQVQFDDYDTVFQSAVGGKENLLNAGTDIVLVFTRLEQLSRAIGRNLNALNEAQVQEEMERIQGYFDQVGEGIRRQTNAMILWHALELPVYPSLGIVDSQILNGQRGLIMQLNQTLLATLNELRNAFLVDVNLCLSRLGETRFYDHRYWHIGRMPYSREAFGNIAAEEFKFVRALKGKNKKCLVLDCDNTLWGGIIGEDNLVGIKLGRNHPGSMYYEFQQEILNLYNRGVILALCSKNNEADVWQVFREHPDMLLREEHIATAQINWRDKVANLRQIALDLNIGLDSLVFIDDSEFEVNLVREALPEVDVLHFPPQEAASNPMKLSAYGWFDTLTLTDEDKMRGEMYKAETDRKKLQAETTDLRSYYNSLEMELEIKFANEFSIPRIAQLTQKTNQFNLTTKRYSEAEIKEFADSRQSDVLSVHLRDRFGDMGIVGVCILCYLEEKSLIDTFLFSCRALGRDVEKVFLQHCLWLAKQRGYKRIVGVYSPTRKNEQVENFYLREGFGADGSDGNREFYEMELANFELQPVEYELIKIESDVLKQVEVLRGYYE